MIWLIWGLVLPGCTVAAWLICRPLRHFLEEIHEDQARDRFRLQREWLEARFLGALARTDPPARSRWEDANWHDQVVWARDRRSRTLLALIGVHFGDDPLIRDDAFHATALFEYRKGRWHADGKRLEETRPDQAFVRHQRLEPLVRPHRRH